MAESEIVILQLSECMRGPFMIFASSLYKIPIDSELKIIMELVELIFDMLKLVI